MDTFPQFKGRSPHINCSPARDFALVAGASLFYPSSKIHLLFVTILQEEPLWAARFFFDSVKLQLLENVAGFQILICIDLSSQHFMVFCLMLWAILVHNIDKGVDRNLILDELGNCLCAGNILGQYQVAYQ